MKFTTPKRLKPGQTVYKNKRYSEGCYCAYGGFPYQVSLGTKGVVKSIRTDNSVVVIFDNGYRWNMDISELEIEKHTLRKMVENPT